MPSRSSRGALATRHQRAPETRPPIHRHQESAAGIRRALLPVAPCGRARRPRHDPSKAPEFLRASTTPNRPQQHSICIGGPPAGFRAPFRYDLVVDFGADIFRKSICNRANRKFERRPYASRDRKFEGQAAFREKRRSRASPPSWRRSFFTLSKVRGGHLFGSAQIRVGESGHYRIGFSRMTMIVKVPRRVAPRLLANVSMPTRSD
jgi:hypothetical protein